MKKEYYKVYIKDGNKNISIPIICETIVKIDTKISGQAYIFRDLITGKIIRPFFDNSTNFANSRNTITLTYNNINENCYSKISQKKVLAFLKGINTEIIEAYQSTINDIENKHIKNLTI